MEYKSIGTHILLDLYECGLEFLNDEYKITEILSQCCMLSGCKEIVKIMKQFSPQGITAVLLLEESHISIHTYPESNMVFVDIFCCGDEARPKKCIDYLVGVFDCINPIIRIIERGVDKNEITD